MSTPGTAAKGRFTQAQSRRKFLRQNGRTSLVVILTGAGILSLGACATPARGTIGAVLVRKDEGRVFVRETPAHLAAAQAGIQPGDELLLVDGQDVRRLSEEELRRALGGQVGEPIALTLVREDRVLRVTLERSGAETFRAQ